MSGSDSADCEFLSAAHLATQAFPVHVRKIDFVSHSENFAYRVETTTDDSYVLRLHRPTYHNRAELESEQLWTEALLLTGIDVPKPVRTINGERYTAVSTPDGARFAGMLEWVEGEILGSHLEDPSPNELADTFLKIGGLFAQLHDQASSWCPPKGFTRHILDVNGFFGDRPFWGRFWESPYLTGSQRDALSDLRETVGSILTEAPKSSENFSMIHADLHPFNVVVNGSRLHMIDFDDCGYGWHAYDFAVALHRFRDSEFFALARDSLLKGYSQFRALDQAVASMIDLFFVVRDLASIGWVSSRPEVNDDLRETCSYLCERAISGYNSYKSNSNKN